MIKARQHSNRKLVWEVPHGLLGAVAERQVRVFPGVESALQVTYEMSALVAGRTKPGAGWLAEHRIKEHHALDHSARSRRLSEAIVRLADSRPQRLVVDVEHAPTMELAREDGRREPTLDERLEEVGALLAVDDAGEAAVLAFDEDTGVQEHLQQKPGLSLG